MAVGMDPAWECMAAWVLWVDQWEDRWEAATKVDGVDLDTKVATVMDHKEEVIKVGVHRVSGEVTADRQAITAMGLKEGHRVVVDHMEDTTGTDGGLVLKVALGLMEEETCTVAGQMLLMVEVQLGHQLLLVQREPQESKLRLLRTALASVMEATVIMAVDTQGMQVRVIGATRKILVPKATAVVQVLPQVMEILLG